MEPFPILHEVSGDRWRLWQQSLSREMGGEANDLQSYLPLWLKKNRETQNIPPFWIELADYEWSLHFVAYSENQIAKGKTTKTISLNPFIRILRMHFDIVEWISGGKRGEPRERPHVLIVAPAGRLAATAEMAMIIDELGEGPQLFEDLTTELTRKHGAHNWKSALDTLAEHDIVLR